MTLVTAADLRPDSVAEFASGCTLDSSDVGDDAKLTAAIARMKKRFEGWCGDNFETFTATMELDGLGGTLIRLPYRTTAITSVKLRTSTGALETQSVDVYRLHSSLNSAGDTAVGDYDWLELVGFPSAGLSFTDISDPYCWPKGPRTVQVVGTCGWTVPDPDAKRGIAMLVWNHFKPIRADLGMASGYSDATGLSVAVAPIDDDHPSGIRDVDAIVQRLRRNTHIGVG